MSLPFLVPKVNDILSEYSFPMKGDKAFESQRLTCKMLANDRRGYVLNDIGTGKTLCALWAYDYLRLIGEANKMLVIAPLSTLENRWASELLTHFPHLRFRILHGSRSHRLWLLQQKNIDVFIINHHGLYVIFEELLARQDINTVTVDELSVYRNGKSKRLTQTLKEYVARRKWVWGMTGSPCPRAVTDVWGPASCISPWTIPKYFTWFRAELMIQVTPFKWVAKPGAEEKAVKCLTPSVRYKLEDCVELPERVFQYYEAPLTPKQKAIYDEMNKSAVALIGTDQIDALNAGAVMSKLLQIACGYVYTRDGTVKELDNLPRLQLTVDLIDSSSHKVLLFAPFKSAINGLHKTLESNTIPHLIIHGDVPSHKRADIFKRFQERDDEKVLLAHPGCMSHGVHLPAASTVVWFGPITSLDVFNQANGRIYRVGQKFKTLIAMIGGSAREKKLYQLLASNERVQNRFLELIATV